MCVYICDDMYLQSWVTISAPRLVIWLLVLSAAHVHYMYAIDSSEVLQLMTS